MTVKLRPKFINLLQIRMPMTAWVSIGHRLSGVLLVLSIPFWLYLFDLSLVSEAGFAQSIALLHSPLVLFFVLIIFWSISHHLFAGIRFLLLDIDIGLSKESANRSAFGAMVAGIILMLILLGLLP